MGTASHTEQLRTLLLMDTLSYCSQRSEWYRSSWASSGEGIKVLDDLVRLPTIDKSTVAKQQALLITDDDFPAHIGISSGTTSSSKAPILTRMYRSKEEVDAFRLVNSILDAGAHPVPLGLQIINFLHGERFAEEERGRFRMPLEMPYHYAHIRDLLLQRHVFRGFAESISYIIATVPSVKLLTGMILREERNLLDKLRISSIYAHSSLLTDRWRSNLQTLFNATVVNIYGISEIAGAGSAECPACGYFHMPPFVIPEIVDLFSDNKRVAIGELTLTSLVPFTRVQPLIRYRTGDLVELTNQCTAVPDIGFRFRGRRTNSVYDQELGFVLGGADVLNIADRFPDINFEEYSAAARLGLDPAGFGLPRLAIKVNRSKVLEVIIVVELCYEPDLNVPARRRFVDEFCLALQSECKELGEHIAAGVVELKVISVAPNALGEQAAFKG